MNSSEHREMHIFLTKRLQKKYSWMPNRISIAITDYIRFIQLLKFIQPQTIYPVGDIDEVWREHLTFKANYDKLSVCTANRIVPYAGRQGLEITSKSVQARIYRTFIAWHARYDSPPANLGSKSEYVFFLNIISRDRAIEINEDDDERHLNCKSSVV